MERGGVILGAIPATEFAGADLSQRREVIVPMRDAGRIDPGDGARWNREHRPNQTYRVPDSVVAKMHEGLPPVIRRTPRQRYKVLVDRLVQDGLKSYKAVGYPVWPKSIQDELKTLGWKEGDPRLYEQVEALATKMIVAGENKQREKDARKVTRDWHGHFD